jgi:hypothetical protein
LRSRLVLFGQVKPVHADDREPHGNNKFPLGYS